MEQRNICEGAASSVVHAASVDRPAQRLQTLQAHSAAPQAANGRVPEVCRAAAPVDGLYDSGGGGACAFKISRRPQSRFPHSAASFAPASCLAHFSPTSFFFSCPVIRSPPLLRPAHLFCAFLPALGPLKSASLLPSLLLFTLLVFAFPKQTAAVCLCTPGTSLLIAPSLRPVLPVSSYSLSEIPHIDFWTYSEATCVVSV